MDLAIEFADQWNNKMNDSVDTVYIFTHGSERMLQFEDGSHYNALTINGKNQEGKEDVAGDLHDLEKKDIDELYIQACNCGHVDALSDPYRNYENVASIFSNKISDGTVYAWDGSVAYGLEGVGSIFNFTYGYQARLSNKQGHFEELTMKDDFPYPDRDPYGQVAYKNGVYQLTGGRYLLTDNIYQCSCN